MDIAARAGPFRGWWDQASSSSATPPQGRSGKASVKEAGINDDQVLCRTHEHFGILFTMSITMSNLIVHETRHREVRCDQCGVCPRSFSRPRKPSGSPVRGASAAEDRPNDKTYTFPSVNKRSEHISNQGNISPGTSDEREPTTATPSTSAPAVIPLTTPPCCASRLPDFPPQCAFKDPPAAG
ncbi:hypothetical protein VOLCADRAFT_86794 [Volvox carteri f. nagariensis]|uniref:Uncharacterized protein n=1 Tax=Volvox carteri f. nagariensis TaxID=3068 RepID=D8TJM0_VOLCA|nr:uncharacterized protein VOLCADRAFT_86794 [Volvox carteri f. nagariensis]EFJ52566.1 hypothetical protein VOLCADRAFT_86794 [Volvox carteri f. nagariensis]|eukprot:XP_002946639.1 hypothetical protein VOLCADRAFT_86794 [Volvox carteri f. nagariensis]